MVIIFLNNKLISCDTIVPFCLEVKKRFPEEKFWFFCAGSRETVNVIRQNVVLKRVIADLGALSYIGEFSSPIINWILPKFIQQRKIAIYMNLIWTVFQLMFRNGKVIHFKFFDHPKIRWITRLKPDSFFFFQSNCWGSTPVVDLADNVFRTRLVDEEIRSWGTYVTFDGYWPKFAAAEKLNLPRFHVGSTRTLSSWLAALNEKFNDLVEVEMKQTNTCDDGRAVGILLNDLTSSTISETVDTPSLYLEKTLRVLWEEFPSRTVFIKPHPVTDTAVMLDIICRSGHKRTFLTQLHAGLLGRICCVVVCNSFSYAIPDCWLSGCRTIEFTRYSTGVNRITKGHSIRPEFIDSFVSTDEAVFASELHRLITAGRCKRDFEQVNDEHMDRLLNTFCQRV